MDPATEAGSMAPGYARGSYYSWSRSRWHSRGANHYPKRTRLFDDLPGLIHDWVVPGHAPPAGMLRLDDSIVTLGSCFARELREHLNDQGVSARNLWIPAGLNNTFAILDFISWCVTGEQTGRGFRYDTTDDGEIRDWTPEAEAESYLRWIRETDAFVFTFGLAEVWQDTETGQVFWRGVPEELYETDRHVFRLTTVEENETNIEQIIALIRSVNPNAPIVLTLSPVPLVATFRDMTCITADCVSKSVLRVALDRVFSRSPENVYYWPSFEVVRWAGGHLASRAYGTDDKNARNVSRYLVAEIVQAFVEIFFVPEAARELQAKGKNESRHALVALRDRVESRLLVSVRDLVESRLVGLSGRKKRAAA